MGNPSGVSIIVPIYNAYEDLQKCIGSILECTDLKRHHLILINDASPDTRIRSYLKRLSQLDGNITCAENETNLGFSGSINLGIQTAGTNDVILLNSDTVVTRNWVEKLNACAYSSPSIATATPLSNNATLCSVPEFLKENALPEGYSLGQYAALIEEISLRSYPRIPVANGFCMYIKRSVIEKIGLLDAETFGRGYGEENDFCYRAEQAGYCHVMCDDTYIYHAGTSSFVSEEKKRYIAEHEKILNERYPEQNHAVAVHCRDNPNQLIQKNIKLWTGLRNGRKNILYLVQSDFRKDSHDHLGGTQLHVKDLVDVMRKKFNVFVAARNLELLNLTAYTEGQEYFFQYYIGKPALYQCFRSRDFAKLYQGILRGFHIDLVHIHHTRDLTLELYYQAAENNIPIITTLHDYYTICPTIKMINYRGKLCLGDQEETCCQECQTHPFQDRMPITSHLDYLPIWRENQKAALLLSKAVIVPSNNTKENILQFYPELSGRFHVIPHGEGMDTQIDLGAEEKMVEVEDPRKRDPRSGSDGCFNVAFLGGISKEKGSLASYKLIKNGPNDVHWYLLGVWGYNELSMLEKNNYTKTGLYEREELPGLLKQYQIDLVCILPIWPETYCYTLSEAILCGIPSIVTDIGALGERMRETDCGWIVPVDQAYEESIKIIERIKGKGSEYQDKQRKAQIVGLSLKTLDGMGRDYDTLYQQSFIKPVNCNLLSSEDIQWVLEHFVDIDDQGHVFSGNADDIKSQLQNLTLELRNIKSSFEYKLSSRMLKIPLIRKTLLAIYAGYIRFLKK